MEPRKPLLRFVITIELDAYDDREVRALTRALSVRAPTPESQNEALVAAMNLATHMHITVRQEGNPEPRRPRRVPPGENENGGGGGG
jgi:hypothetical protein